MVRERIVRDLIDRDIAREDLNYADLCLSNSIVVIENVLYTLQTDNKGDNDDSSV